MTWQVLKLVAVSLSAIAIAGCGGEMPSHLPSANATAAPRLADHEAGRKIYNFRCYYCHGYSGDAKTLASTYLNPKPLAFNAADANHFNRARIIEAIRTGRTGTAMAGFHTILSQREIELVADFVREEFMLRKAVNTRYHTAENGWPDHQRYRDAFPFATGDIAVDAAWEHLSPQQAAGKRLYLASCVSCHDRGRASDEQVAWELRAVSYPPNQDSCSTCHSADGQLRPSAKHMANGKLAPHAPHGKPSPSEHAQKHPDNSGPYAVHDIAPQIADLNAQERRGETLYQKNCAFCHAADGTGRNWIGAFLEPHPRDFTDARAMTVMTQERLLSAIREGKPGSSMPAWKFVLEEQDIRAVAAYISRAFVPRAVVGQHARN